MIDKEKLRDSFDLVKYVGGLTDLKQRNGEWWGCCPLHNEKTPSFHIHRNGEEWFCQGCGNGGDSFSFVATYNGLDINREFKQVCEIMGGEDYEIEPIERTRRAAEPKEKIKKPVTEEQVNTFYKNGEPYERTKTYYYGENLVKCRYENGDKKTFIWYHSDDENWYYGSGGLQNGLYWSIPEGMEKHATGPIFIAEGEKSADAVAECGYICVSASDGGDEHAKKWKNEYTQELVGYDLYILNDDDCLKEINKGKLYADNVAYKVQDVANLVNRIDINNVHPNKRSIDGYDIADILQELGVEKTREKLSEFLQTTTYVGNDDEINKSIIEKSLGTTNESVVEVVTKAVGEIMKASQISFDTLENISVVAKRTGISKRILTNKINEIVADRKKNQNTTIVQSSSNSTTITLGENTWDISETGFECLGGKIISEKTGDVILPHICVYAAIVYDVEEGTCRDMLLYNTVKRPFEINHIVVNAEDIRSSQKTVAALSPYNIDITSANACEFNDFLQQMRVKQGENINEIREINRIGWYDGYLLPYEMAQSSVIIKDGTNEKKIANAYMDCKGSKDKSLEMIKEVLNNVTIAPIVLGTIVSSLFMERAGLKGQTHVLNISGMSGKGKSVLIKLLYSMFGDSANTNNMFGGSDATVQSSQNTAGYLRNFALYLDDPMQAGKDEAKTAQQRIYNLVSGEGRQRLNRFGDSRKSKEWYCNILYTNESSLYSADETVKGGVLSRILDIELEKEISQDNINKWLVDIAKNNYGHFGVDFANMIRNTMSEDIIEMIQNEYEVFSKIGVDRKRGNTASCIAVGFKLACKVLGVEMEFPYNTVLKNVSKAGEISDGARAYIVFDAWLDGNIEKFRQIIDKNDVIWGTLDYCHGTKVVNVQISKLREICNQLNIPRDSMITYCANNFIIVVNKEKSTRTVFAKDDEIKVVSFYHEWNAPQTRDIKSNNNNNNNNNNPFEDI